MPLLSGVVTFLGGLFGFKAGASVANTAGGLINHTAALSALYYLCDHASQQINLGEVSLGFLALIVGFAYVILELFRRRLPGAGGE